MWIFSCRGLSEILLSCIMGSVVGLISGFFGFSHNNDCCCDFDHFYLIALQFFGTILVDNTKGLEYLLGLDSKGHD